MENRIIRNVDGVLSRMLMVVMYFVWTILLWVGIAFLVLARAASNVCAKSHIRLGKVHDNYECAKENVDCVNRMLCYECEERFKELLTKMFKVEA